MTVKVITQLRLLRLVIGLKIGSFIVVCTKTTEGQYSPFFHI